MKIIGMNCSPRKGKSTYHALAICLESVRETHPEMETEIIELGGLDIHGCLACGICKKDLTCAIDDDFKSLIPKLADPEIGGMVIGAPVYMGTMTSQCKAFLDRSCSFRRNGFLFRDRVGGVLAVGGIRNGGQELTIQAVQAALLIHDMIIVSDGMDTAHFGGTLWNANDQGLEPDEFGRKLAGNLGRRVADVVWKIRK
ncbi:MAG: flavodoxin family protein [Candidatus Omnitrophota bacterium]|jgi:multimeric flavodoxin WrbA|nr:MAG: flavodoxin family protein [Candidatus Omnitrophota bacterium]